MSFFFRVCMYECMCVCVCACVRACVRTHVCLVWWGIKSVWVCACVRFKCSWGEFNKASARRAFVGWYLSLFIMCKAWLASGFCSFFELIEHLWEFRKLVKNKGWRQKKQAWRIKKVTRKRSVIIKLFLRDLLENTYLINILNFKIYIFTLL